MAYRWQFLDFVDDRNRNTIRAWLEGIPDRAELRIEATLRRVRDAPTLQRPEVGSMVGDCKGLLELRVQCERVQYRPLMCYGPGQREVTILLGATEQNRKIYPPGSCAQALKLKERIGEAGRTEPHFK
jgi:hypothetical protein